MPAIYYLLSGVMRWYDVAHRVDDVLAVVFAARTIMWLFAGAAFVFTFLAATRLAGRTVAWLGTALLSLSVVFLSRTLEIRPDVPATAFWIASQWALLEALGAVAARRGSRGWWALSGFMLGSTLAFTQKALLAGPGFAAFAALYLLTRVDVRSIGAKLGDLALFAAAVVAPLLLIAVPFWRQGALGVLVHAVLLGNLGWVQELRASTTLNWMLLRDPLFCALASAGFVRAAAQVLRDPDRVWIRAALFLPTASILAGLFVIPAPYTQYLLPILPMSAIYAGDFLVSALSRSTVGATSRLDTIERAISVAVLVAVAIVGLTISRPFFRNAAIYPLMAVAVCGAVVWLHRKRWPELACAMAVAGVSIYSAQQLVWMAGLDNAETLTQIRFVHSVTTPTDRVMDGFTGVGWFRRHAAFYWITSPGVLPLISEREKEQMARMVTDCGEQPRLVILDDHLTAVTPRIEEGVRRRYHPTDFPLIWVREDPGPACGARPGEVNISIAKSLPTR